MISTRCGEIPVRQSGVCRFAFGRGTAPPDPDALRAGVESPAVDCSFSSEAVQAIQRFGSRDTVQSAQYLRRAHRAAFMFHDLRYPSGDVVIHDHSWASVLIKLPVTAAIAL